jgi:hypothetical protein
MLREVHMVKAIDTRYAGCRFRSRLEARWAVFFDHHDIGWKYEYQGFEVDGRAYLPDFLLDCGTWVEVKGDEASLDRPLMLAAASQLPSMPAVCESGPRLLILGEIPDPPADADLGWLGFSAEPCASARVKDRGRLLTCKIGASNGLWTCTCGTWSPEPHSFPGTCGHVRALHRALSGREAPGVLLRSLNYHDTYAASHRYGFGVYEKNRRPWILFNYDVEPRGWLTPVRDHEYDLGYAKDAYLAARSARFEHGEHGAR